MMENNKKGSEFETININSLLKILKKEFKIIVLFIVLFALFGIIYALNTPKEYISVGKIMPEVAHKPSNGMGAIFEVLKKYNSNLDLYNTEITRSELYEEIIKTKEFYDYLLTKNVQTINKKINFKTYLQSNLENENTFFPKSNVKIEDYNFKQKIEKRIEISCNKKNNLILVSAKMPDPIVASNIANYTIDYLINYITKYRTNKATQELNFIENLLKENSKDKSKEVFTKEIQNGLIASILQMKIKIEEDKPLIEILDKPEIPVNGSEPSKKLIILIFTILGFTIGIIISIFKDNNFRLLK